MNHIAPRMALITVLAIASVELCSAQPRSWHIATIEEAPSAETSASVSDDPWSLVELEPPVSTRVLARREIQRSGMSTGGVSQVASASWLRTLMSLGAVVGLIGLLAWGYRAVSGNGGLALGTRTRRTAMLEVVSRTSIGPRHSLCLVRVGPRLVLLGVSKERISAVDVISDESQAAQILGQHAKLRDDSHSAEFGECLKREGSAYAAESAAPEQKTAQPAPAASRVREQLADTIARVRTAIGQA